MAIDTKQLAAVRKLLSVDDEASVDQGVQLVASLADPDVWKLLAGGVLSLPPIRGHS